MADDGHYKKEGSTRQGIYVCSPNGTLLSSINSLNPDAVLESIMIGLDKWKLLPESDRYLALCCPLFYNDLHLPFFET